VLSQQFTFQFEVLHKGCCNLVCLHAGSLAATSSLQAAAASYTSKDVLVLHSNSKCSPADDVRNGSSAACSRGNSSSKGTAAVARYLDGTFGHHLTQRCWQAAPSTLKL
jgi:hypothetical protein